MDMEMEQLKDTVNKTFDQVGVSKGNKLNAEQIMELVNRENFRAATHGNAPFVKVPPPV
jgi:small subunit ribosomal protein S10